MAVSYKEIDRCSIQLERGRHREDGYADVEQPMRVHVEDCIHAMHASYLSLEIAAADILIPSTRLNHRLYPYHTLALYLAASGVAVEDIPVPSQDLHRKRIMVLNGHSVGEHVLPVDGV